MRLTPFPVLLLLATASFQSVFSIPVRRIFVPPSDTASSLPVLQSALDSLKSLGGGTLVLGEGVYRIDADSGELKCSGCRGIRIEGRGDRTLIRVGLGKRGQAGAITFLESDSIAIRSVRMEGDPLPSAAWGGNARYHGAILFSHCRAVSVDSCSFKGFFTGAAIFQSLSSSIRVRGCRFDGVAYKMSGDYGAIALESGSGNARIVDNTFSNLSHSAISAYASEKLDISGNHALFDTLSEYSMGFYAPQGLRHSRIADNRFIHAHNEGIIMAGGRGAVESNEIVGNTLVSRFSGITVNEGVQRCAESLASGVLIESNRISGFGKPVEHGILLNRVTGVRLIGNRISSAIRGINVQNCSQGNTANGNVIDSTATGIVWTGNGTLSANKFTEVGTGIDCDHAETISILRNRYRRVGSRVKQGPKALRILTD